MSKQTIKRLVPKIRFPEFREAGEWEEKKLGDLSEILRGGSPRPIDEYITSDIDGLNWLKIGDVDQGSKYVTFTKERVLLTALSKSREVNPGDLIMSNSMSFGRPYILKIKSCIHDGWIAVTKIDDRANRDYLYYLILSPTSQEYFLNNAAGSGVQNLNADIIKLLPVLTPKYSEQQKIADCLSSIDELITAQTQQLDGLKTHKKGLMQQLFPAEGENLPRLRFPEFRDKDGWNNEELEKLYSFKVTNSFPRDKLNYEKGSVKNIHYGDIHTKFSTLFDIRNEIVPFVNPTESLEKIKPECYCIEGDIVFADASEDLDDVGKSIEIIHLNNEKLLSGMHTLLARRKDKKLIIGFAGYLFKSDKIRDQIKKESQGAKVLGISAGRLSNIEISFPPEEKEQQKIADCLSSIDELITAQTQKLDALKTHKKGLMQQLFTSIDEVNG